MIRVIEKYPLAITPEPKRSSQNESHSISAEVVSQRGSEIQDVMCQPKAQQRDPHADGIEQEEECVFALESSFLSVTKCPMAIGEIREGCGHTRADDLGC